MVDYKNINWYQFFIYFFTSTSYIFITQKFYKNIFKVAIEWAERKFSKTTTLRLNSI